MPTNKLTKEQLFQALEKDGPGIKEEWSGKALRGVGEALLAIADFYYKKGDGEKELAWLKIAAEKNVPHAYYRIGYRYHFGEGVPQNYLISIEFYIKAVKGNHKTAKLRLAQSLKNGCGVNADKIKALEWYYKYDISNEWIVKLDKEGYVLEQEHKDKPIHQLIMETEEVLGQEKERCNLAKDVDLTDLDQSKAFKGDSKQVDMLELENCLLKEQLQEQDKKINAMKKASQDAAILYVKEKRKLKDELVEKDNKIKLLQKITENLMDKMKRERDENDEVVSLGFSAWNNPQNQDLVSNMDSLSVMEDQNWSFDDNHVDFYVYRKKNYKSLNGDHKISSVDVHEGGDCNLLDYS